MGEFYFSQRTDWELSPNQITQHLASLKENDVQIYDLTTSNPTRCGFDYSSDILSALDNQDNLNYQNETQGLMPARQHIADYYDQRNISIDPKCMFLTASTSEAYTYLFRLLTNSGDHVLFPKPSYPLFPFLCDLNDVSIRHYPLVYDKGWHYDIDQIEASMSEKTKAIVLVNPNNPTGTIIDKKIRQQLVELCRSRNVAIISDEVFMDFMDHHEPSQFSLAGIKDALVFTLGGLSKTLALPQMKLSWINISGPEDLAAKACQRLEVVADTYLSVNAPSQNALKLWLHNCEDIQTQIKGRLQNNRTFLEKYLLKRSVQLCPSPGGWYAVCRIPLKYSEEEWVLKFLLEKHVYVHPGFFYDFHEDGHIVISLLTPEDILKDGMERLMCIVQDG